METGLKIACQHVMFAALGWIGNLLCDFRNVDSTFTQKCDRDADVVHDLLEDEEPDGVPYPASVRSEQAESVESNGNASKHWSYDSEMHADVDPLEKANRSGYAQEHCSVLANATCRGLVRMGSLTRVSTEAVVICKLHHGRVCSSTHLVDCQHTIIFRAMKQQIGLTQVIRRKTSSIRNLRRIIILEIIRAATSTVEIASMTHVIIASPSPMLWSSGSVVGKGLSARLTPSNMPSMLAVLVCSCLFDNETGL